MLCNVLMLFFKSTVDVITEVAYSSRIYLVTFLTVELCCIDRQLTLPLALIFHVSQLCSPEVDYIGMLIF